jgi:DNA polymerase-3 subunit epsilon
LAKAAEASDFNADQHGIGKAHMRRAPGSTAKETGGFIAVDVETTGFSPLRGDRIIEIAAVAFNGDGITKEFQSLINAGKRIPFHARQVHGITDEMLIGAPAPAEVFEQFQSFVEASVLVAHNAAFDVGFLRHEFARLGMGFDKRYQCTLEICRKRYPKLPNHRLETVCRHLFGREMKGVRLHRALDDARLVARVWMEMGKRI